ncbi:MAG: histidinol dehydrogenase [Pseudomonadales bacterium]|jgi:histidinol dehydrogenase|nr:histidinol dehydrogenase [Pseudomonadales bacterium]MBP9032655.1 histidinol dehydrogenase [Pseudomonadales bacterium]
MMRRLDASAPGFAGELEALLDFSAQRDAGVVERVAAIIADVRARGDAALLEYTNRLDARELADAAALEITGAALAQAEARIPAQLREALQAAAARIESYHLRQRQESWQYRDADGTLLGQRITALDRAGLYVPGGKASYPSSVLMNAIPARVAGVGELVMVVPAPRGELNDVVLAAAAIAGVDRVFTIGGAQAVAALAFGTATVPRVDKIVGPGNVYVAEAKRQVFGEVGIDMIAGPSEIAVICDGGTDPEWIALDLFSQAEHDEHAQALLISPDAAFLDAVARCIERLLPTMARAAIIGRSLRARGALVLVRDLAEAADICNRIAPEHLELSVAEPEQLLAAIRHAGAVFLGRHTPEAIGDYCAGPSHVLPTAGTARFASPLGVHDFQKRSSLIGCSPAGADRLGGLARVLAQAESLQAHALSAAARVRKAGAPG